MTSTHAIFTRLKEDHDRHREILDRLAEADAESERRSLFEAFTKEVKGHAAAEE